MAKNGCVHKECDGLYKGYFRTICIWAEIDIVPNQQNLTETSGRKNVSLSIAAPEFNPKKLYAVIWNPGD